MSNIRKGKKLPDVVITIMFVDKKTGEVRIKLSSKTGSKLKDIDGESITDLKAGDTITIHQ